MLILDVSLVFKRFWSGFYLITKEIVYVAIGNNKTISHHLKKTASGTLKVDEDFIGDVKL